VIKKTVVEMLKFQIMNEGYNYLNLDEDLLYKNKFDNYIKKETDERNDNNENITVAKEESKENEIISELYSDEIKEEKEKKENQNENENEFDEDNIQPININEEIKKVS